MTDPEVDYKRLFELSYRALLVVDNDNTIINCNAAAEKLIACSKNELSGKSLSELRQIDKTGRKLGFRIISSTGEKVDSHSIVEMQVVEHEDLSSDFTDDPGQLQIALIDDHQQYRILAESTLEAIFMVDRDGHFLFMNKIAAERLGGEVCDFVGKTMWDVFPQAVADTHMNSIRKVFDTGESITDDSEPELLNHKVPYSTSLAPIRVKSGDIVAVLGIARDMSKLVEVKSALKDREEEWRSLLANIPDIITTVAPDGTVLSLNRTLLKYDIVDKAIGTKIYDYIHKDYHDVVKKTLESVLSTGEPGIYEILADGADGPRSAWWESRVVPLECNGDEQSVMIISRDVTEMKIAAQMLKESEERFRELADLLPLTVYEADREGRFTFANRQALKLTGYTSDDLIRGLHVLDLFDPGEHETVMARVRETMDERINVEREYDLVRKDGSKVPVMIYSSPIQRGGSVYGIRGIVVDITERKRFEQELRRAYADLQKEQKQLLETNIALREVLGHIEEERKETGREIHANMTRMVYPLLKEMRKKLGESAEIYTTMLKSILSDLTSPYLRTLESRFSQLTRREMQVCEMIRTGKNTSQIAEVLNISVLTVNKFRQQIRRKLELSGTKTNLATYLKSLDLKNLKRK